MATKSGVKNVRNVSPRAKRSDPSPSPNPSPAATSTRRGGGGSFAPGRTTSTPAAPDLTPARGGVVGKAPVAGGGGGGGGGGGVGPGAPGGGPVGFDSFSTGGDELGGDAQYQAQLAALMKALQDADADFGAQRGRYETSFGESLRGLGYTPEVADDPNTLVNEAMPGAWAQDDLNTASGRSLQNQQNDFASRGLLQSSLYARSKDDLMRSLNDQLSGMQGSRTSFLDDLARQQGAFQNDNTAQQQQAKAEALARRAAGLSL